jgi:hypothetical protein
MRRTLIVTLAAAAFTAAAWAASAAALADSFMHFHG